MPAKASGKDWSSLSGRDKTCSAPNLKPRMAYRVRIMPRAKRDLSSVYARIGAGGPLLDLSTPNRAIKLRKM